LGPTSMIVGPAGPYAAVSNARAAMGGTIAGTGVPYAALMLAELWAAQMLRAVP